MLMHIHTYTSFQKGLSVQAGVSRGALGGGWEEKQRLVFCSFSTFVLSAFAQWAHVCLVSGRNFGSGIEGSFLFSF